MADAWDDKFADFLERVMAAAVSGGDPKPLKEELERLLTAAPAAKLRQLKLERPHGKPAATKPPTR